MKRNAIILAAGTASRFVPLSEEVPKGLIEVKGEILLERQIEQLNEAGITDIVLVVGYMAEKFHYLKGKYGVDIVMNEDYKRYNNISSMIRVVTRLDNTYILTSDNYYPKNPFINDDCSSSYYSAIYADGPTDEYCIETDDKDVINRITIGGCDSWFMYGPVFFSRDFSRIFSGIIKKEYDKEEVRGGYWEDLYIKYMSHLPMKMRKCSASDIMEFDSIDELRVFDPSYIEDTRSKIIRNIAKELECKEGELCAFNNLRPESGISFQFECKGNRYEYTDGLIRSLT